MDSGYLHNHDTGEVGVKMINNIRSRNRNGGLITTEGVVSALGTRLASAGPAIIIFYLCAGGKINCV